MKMTMPIAGMPLGMQMAAASYSMRAPDLGSVVAQMDIVTAFEGHFGFSLPRYYSGSPLDEGTFYSQIIAPAFAHAVRPIFSDKLQELASGQGSLGLFRKAGLIDMKVMVPSSDGSQLEHNTNLPDVALAGLLTFGALDSVLALLRQEMGKPVDEIFTPAKLRDVYSCAYSLDKLLFRGVAYALLNGSAIVIGGPGPMFVMPAVCAAVELAAFICGDIFRFTNRRALKREFIEELPRWKSGVVSDLETLGNEPARLAIQNWDNPDYLRFPGFRLEMLAKTNGVRAAIVQSVDDLARFSGEKRSYVVVILRNGRMDIRSCPYDGHSHTQLVMDPDKVEHEHEQESIVGAGTFVYFEDQNRLFIDGVNASFRTGRDWSIEIDEGLGGRGYRAAFRSGFMPVVQKFRYTLGDELTITKARLSAWGPSRKPIIIKDIPPHISFIQPAS